MNIDRESIIRMAREAGIVFDDRAAPFYERFFQAAYAAGAAAATEEANRRANASWTLMCEKMVKAERHECAKLVDGKADGCTGLLEQVLRSNAAAIRARGQA